MALIFGAATSDRVDCGSAASLDNFTVATWLAWLYPTTLTSGRRLFEKDATPIKVWLLSGTGGNLRLQVAQSTSPANYISNVASIATNTWCFVAATYDQAATPRIHLYSGRLGTAVAEDTYGTTTDGSGTATADGAGNLVIGNKSAASFNGAFEGRIAAFAYVNAVLTLGQIQSWQYHPRSLASTPLFMRLGYAGTGVQPDWSGNGNAGTVTGATVGDDVPLRPPFGADPEWSGAFTVAAAGGVPTLVGASFSLAGARGLAG